MSDKYRDIIFGPGPYGAKRKAALKRPDVEGLREFARMTGWDGWDEWAEPADYIEALEEAVGFLFSHISKTPKQCKDLLESHPAVKLAIDARKGK